MCISWANMFQNSFLEEAKERGKQCGPEAELETEFGTCVYKSTENLNSEEERSASTQGLELVLATVFNHSYDAKLALAESCLCY